MIKVKRIDHVAIAVADRDGCADGLTELFGLTVGAREHVAGQATDVAFLHTAGADGGQAGADDGQAGADGGQAGADDGQAGAERAQAGAERAQAALEICAPNGNASLERFLARRGPGLHHVCFEVEDLRGALATLKAAGVRLIDETPRPGARGHEVAFLHPASTGGVLFELCAGSSA